MSINCNSCKHESLLYSDNPCKSCVSYCNFESNLEEKARVKAIKEFADRLKETKFKHGNDYIIYADNIDNLVKEMIGESNG